MSTSFEFADADVSAWSGRTSLVGSIDDLFNELDHAAYNPSRHQSAVFAKAFYETLRYPLSAPTSIPRPDQSVVSADGFSGWELPSVPAFYHIAPLPIPFVIPMDQNDCPVAALRPWWDKIRLPSHREKSPLASAPAGLSVSFRSRGVDGWAREDPHGLGEWTSGHMDVMTDSIDAWTVRKAAVSSISRPGLFGSMVPLYAETRKLAAGASTRIFRSAYGCRIPFESISAIEVRIRHHLTGPRVAVSASAKDLQLLAERRGYGDMVGFELSVEFSDGWRPYSVELSGGHLSGDMETGLVPFVTWLARLVAFYRLEQHYLNKSDRGAAENLSNHADSLEPEINRNSSYFWRNLRIEIPGHRPVSVEL